MRATASPLGISNRGRYIPWCSAALSVLCILVFLCCLIPGNTLKNDGSFSVLYLLHSHEYYRLVTACFLHGDMNHLINNLILLYFGGEIVERSFGRIRYLILFFGSGIFGNLLSALYEFSTGSYYDTIGASGACFGIIGGLLFMVVAKRGYGSFISLRRMMLMVLLSLYSGFSNPGINNAAHIGGLISGFIIAFLVLLIPNPGKKGRF